MNMSRFYSAVTILDLSMKYMLQ